MSDKKSVLWFVILVGVVSLCADATYEGARSITGAYLGSLGRVAPLSVWSPDLGS
ncbi:hypothetical protein [Leptodesmis sp.]|uniref:hypothetical protein n=1 Tax=Leptodesmis sp. TaxID=3100501 RepID=UPI0040534C99